MTAIWAESPMTSRASSFLRRLPSCEKLGPHWNYLSGVKPPEINCKYTLAGHVGIVPGGNL
jgi:hypothetical protein